MTKKESGKQVKNNIKITDRHESLKHDSMKEHKRSKLLFEVKNSTSSTRKRSKTGQLAFVFCA